MGFEEMEGGVCVHFGGDYAQQVFFDGENVDGREPVAVGDYLQTAAEVLGFLPLPVEMDADGYVFQGEAVALGMQGSEEEGVVFSTFIYKAPVGELPFLFSGGAGGALRCGVCFGGELIVALEKGAQDGRGKYAYFYSWLCIGVHGVEAVG
jgi:hypothetical protein